ncbi:MAG: hypothetical protein IPM64_17330 [Phycisphaerales bacterium]|nr:hypothetical protein [Phycisphaerales bacterium]
MMLHLCRSRGGVWAFNDSTRGLRAEPFVGETNRAIDRHAGGRDMVTILFSGGPIPGSQLRLDRISADAHGSWWTPSDGGEQCWLCPALYQYFDSAPESIHVVFHVAGTDSGRHADSRSREQRACDDALEWSDAHPDAELEDVPPEHVAAVARDPAQAAYALGHVHDLTVDERATLEAAAKGVTA